MLATYALSVLIAASGPAQSVDPWPVADEPPRIELRISPFADLLFLARSDAAAELNDDGWGEVRNAVDRIDDALGDPGAPAWGLIVSAAALCDDAHDFAAVAERLPESMPRPGGSEIQLRSLARNFAAALQAVEPAFRDRLWPARREVVERRRIDLEASLVETSQRWMPIVLQGMNMRAPQSIVPVYLVHDAPAPGAITFRTQSGGVCFVSIHMPHDEALHETIIHEMMHAFDVSTAEEPTALVKLRAALREAGVRAGDPRMRDLPHALIFIHAAETVRRALDPAHVDYGITSGVYERMSGAMEARAAWQAYLDQTLTLDDAIERIVSTCARSDR